MARSEILNQDKDYKGKLSEPVVKKIIEDFEKRTKELVKQSKKVGGYLLKGGIGMTKGAKEVWNNFKKRQESQGRKCRYLTNDQTNKWRESLEQKEKNKLKNKLRN